MKKREYQCPIFMLRQFEIKDVLRVSGSGGDVYAEDTFDEN